MEAISVDAYLQNQILRITAIYDPRDPEEGDQLGGGWGVRSCAEAHMTIVIPNVSGNPYLNVSLGFGLDPPTQSSLFAPWVGELMPEKGFINASFDPRLQFSDVHVANWVDQGNISLRSLSSTHLELLSRSGNISASQVQSSAVMVSTSADGQVDLATMELNPLEQITVRRV